MEDVKIKDDIKYYQNCLISILYESPFTSTEIAKKAEISISQVSRIMSGKSLPRFSTLCKLLSGIGIDIIKFLENPNLNYSDLFESNVTKMSNKEIKKLRKIISENIRLIQYNNKRYNKYFTQSYMANLLGIEQKHLDRLLMAKHDLEFETFISLSTVLDVRPSELIKIKEEKELMDINTFIKKFKEIKEMGYVHTLRKGDTGVGHTLEQLIGLSENNISLPDLGEAELKAARRKTSSMLTLFTKEPLSNKGRNRDKYLLETFAYESLKEDRTRELYTTISALDFNSQGFKLDVTENKIRIIHKNIPLDVYWTADLLKTTFENKFPSLIYVYADNIGEDSEEKFHYTEAYLLKGFDFEGFIKAVKKGYIKVDLRMHMKKNGQPRNHGTAFRIIRNQIPICFNIQQRLV